MTSTINLDQPDMQALRNQFGDTLVALGAQNPNIVVLDGDLACSTQTQRFANQFPERFFNQGIAEQDLVNTAAGLATTGKIPFVSTFALFITGRAWDQLRNTVCYSNLNVKICPTHSGLSLGEDGASHQSIEDIALTRVIPGLTVLVPSDAPETDRMVRWAADYVGPVYLRLVRPACPVLHTPEQLCDYDPLRIERLRTGQHVTLAATGETVYHAWRAAETLAKHHGIEADVLNVRCIKPLDVETLLASVDKTGRVVTVESHQVLGGLGGAICEALCEHRPVPVLRLGVQDTFGQSGTGEALFEAYGIDWQGITRAVRGWITPPPPSSAASVPPTPQ
jgi:transketolase